MAPAIPGEKDPDHQDHHCGMVNGDEGDLQGTVFYDSRTKQVFPTCDVDGNPFEEHQGEEQHALMRDKYPDWFPAREARHLRFGPDDGKFYVWI